MELIEFITNLQWVWGLALAAFLALVVRTTLNQLSWLRGPQNLPPEVCELLAREIRNKVVAVLLAVAMSFLVGIAFAVSIGS